MRSGILSAGAVATLCLVVGGCAGDDESNTAATAATAASSSSEASSPTSTRVVCPNFEGGSCLGPIAAGTYTTKVFSPTLTFTVPDGWSNFEDTPGNFLLVPEPYDLPGVNADTSDFIGVYSTIAAPNGCDPGTAPGVGFTPEDLNAWYERHPGLDVTSMATTIGGRTGFVLDVRMRTDWTTTCPYSNGNPVVPMLVGTGTSGLDHNIGAGRAWRLYLLNNLDGTMAIEVVDIADAGHLDAYAMIVEAMVFDG